MNKEKRPRRPRPGVKSDRTDTIPEERDENGGDDAEEDEDNEDDEEHGELMGRRVSFGVQ